MLETSGIAVVDQLKAQQQIRNHTSVYSKFLRREKPIPPARFNIRYFGGPRKGEWRMVEIMEWTKSRFEMCWALDVDKQTKQLYYLDLIGEAEKL